MNKFDFTVVIPVYNTEPAALYESVRSVLPQRQTLGRKYNVLLVDDASTNDATRYMIDHLVESNRDTLGSYTLEKNSGTSGALNVAHELIGTEWIALQGSDDISDRERFARQVMALQKSQENIDVIGTNLFSYADHDIHRTPLFTSNHPWNYRMTDRRTLERVRASGWFTNHGTAIYRVQAAIDAGGYDLSLRRAQDVDLWKRMDKMNKQIRTLPDVLYAWRRYKLPA